MPTYEYVCPKCGHQFEQDQKITEEPLKVCPQEECKGEDLKRLVGKTGFILNGGGWAKDGY